MAWRKWIASAGVTLLTLASPASAQQAAGDWHGELSFGASALPIEVGLVAGGDGTLSGSWRSPEQNPQPLVLANISFAGTSLSFDIPQDAARFTATWDPARKAWTGTWSQVAAVPLVLLPGKLASAPQP